MFFIICRCCPSSCAVSTNQGNSLSFLMTLLMSCLGIYLLLKCKSLGYNMAFKLRSEFHCIHMYTKMITFLILPKSSLSVLTCSYNHIFITSYSMFCHRCQHFTYSHLHAIGLNTVPWIMGISHFCIVAILHMKCIAHTDTGSQSTLFDLLAYLI